MTVALTLTMTESLETSDYRFAVENCVTKIHSQSWSKMPSKSLSCIGFLYKVVQKIDSFSNNVLRSFLRIDLKMAELGALKLGTIANQYLFPKRC